MGRINEACEEDNRKENYAVFYSTLLFIIYNWRYPILNLFFVTTIQEVDY